MLSFGQAPFLECSGAGDGRFSAFRARLPGRGNKTIEEIYQAAKVFPDGSTGLTWREAKGKKPVNARQVRGLYSQLWDEYFEAFPELLGVINQYNGFTDLYGQKGHACQAEEVHRIRFKACIW